MQDNIYSVSEINAYLKNMLDGDAALRNVQVLGEISNFKRYPSGHCYFTLKDGGAVLKAVMFRSRAMTMRFVPHNGDTVLAVGRIAVYERDGVYQLYTDLLIKRGAGDLMLAYERLKQKLEAEGLFDEERKRSLPAAPHTVGIITSSAGAAVRDIITVAGRRNKNVRLLLYPVRVQGEEAPAEIARAVKFFNRQGLADVLIVGRGGGSIEELWAFNEEETVRAVAASKIPVISAVGHETDFTLCDFAADRRAATPSQAAELAVADAAVQLQRLEYLLRRSLSLLTGRLEKEELQLQTLCAQLSQEPESMFADNDLRLDAAWKALAGNMEQRLRQREHAFQLLAARLDGLSPLSVLARGYSVTQTADYRLVTSAAEVQNGAKLVTTVSDGKIISIVHNAEVGAWLPEKSPKI